jgi:hypothetical protein
MAKVIFNYFRLSFLLLELALAQFLVLLLPKMINPTHASGLELLLQLL